MAKYHITIRENNTFVLSRYVCVTCLCSLGMKDPWFIPRAINAVSTALHAVGTAFFAVGTAPDAVGIYGTWLVLGRLAGRFSRRRYPWRRALVGACWTTVVWNSFAASYGRQARRSL